jgi:hypothetical protein
VTVGGLTAQQVQVARQFRARAWPLHHEILAAARYGTPAPRGAWQAIADMVRDLALPGVSTVGLDLPEGAPAGVVVVGFPPFVHPAPQPYPDTVTPAAPIVVDVDGGDWPTGFSVTVFPVPFNNYSSCGGVTVTCDLVDVPLVLPGLVAAHTDAYGLGNGEGRPGRLATPQEVAEYQSGASDE